ncbi:MAG: thermonuclease family protein [Halioglobus sp.]
MSGRRKRNRSMRNLKVAAVFLVGVSVFQFISTGTITWPQSVFDELQSYITRPGAGWRQASDALNDAVPGKSQAQDFALNGRVVRIADGDTLSLLDANNDQHKIRLFGIDAPERDQPYGKASGRALSKLVADRIVGIQEKDIDNYGRVVGVVYLDGVNINARMVEMGYAWRFGRYAGYDADLASIEEQAISEKRGLWQDKSPEPPWEWRRRNRR